MNNDEIARLENKFLDILKSFVKDTEKIESMCNFTNNESAWFLKMQAMQRSCKHSLKKKDNLYFRRKKTAKEKRL